MSRMKYRQETFIATPNTKKFWLHHYRSLKGGKILKVSKWKGTAGGTGWKITARRGVYWEKYPKKR